MTTTELLLGILGGFLMGLSSIGLMLYLGRIAGIIGIIQASLFANERAWRGVFIAGLILGSSLVFYFTPHSIEIRTDFPLALLALSGLLVGLGVAVGNGCTSGHGICGISRLSKRSLVATAVFFATALLTRYIVHDLLELLP